MAGRAARPGRVLIVFLLGVAILYGLVALGGNWKPALGLDLQGGTRITLVAKATRTPRPWRRRARSSTSASTPAVSPRPR